MVSLLSTLPLVRRPACLGVALATITGFALGGCSAGEASVVARVLPAQDRVSLRFESSSSNEFSFDQWSCETQEGGGCTLEIPTAQLSGGWNRLELDSKKAVDGGPLLAEFHLGDAVFRRSCTVGRERDRGELSELELRLRCSFPQGFAGRVFGRPLESGEAVIPARKLDLPSFEGLAGVDEPLARAEIPLEVVNAAGGSWVHPVFVALPLPMVQVAVDGWDDPWYESAISLSLRAEPGAEIEVDGEALGVARPGRPFRYSRDVDVGPNQVLVEADLDGKLSTAFRINFVGKHPDTPLYISQPTESELEIRQSEFRIEGRTLAGAKVYLGRRPLDVDRKGRFAVDLLLEEGRHEFELMAVYDSRRGKKARPASFAHFVVHHVPRDLSPKSSLLSEDLMGSAARILPKVAADPWANQGAQLKVVAVLESVASQLRQGSCRARALARACSEEGTAPVQLGFQAREARACIGYEFPVILQFPDCPRLRQGERIRLAGEVSGAEGGLLAGQTVQRAEISVSAHEPWPFAAELGR